VSRFSLDLQEPHRALLDPKDRVINERVISRHLDAKFHHRRPSSRDQGGLNAPARGAEEVAFSIDAIEDLPDDVKRGEKIRPGVAEENPHPLARFRRESPLTHQRPDAAVEDDKPRVLREPLRVGEREPIRPRLRIRRVELALHDVELAIRAGQSLLRLNEDQAVHPVGDVVHDRRGGAVVDEEARVEELKPRDALLALHDGRHLRPATRSGDRVKVDVVGHPARVAVREMELERIADPGSNERSGDAPAERPELVPGSAVEFGHLDARVQADAHESGVLAPDRRGHRRRIGQRRLLDR